MGFLFGKHTTQQYRTKPEDSWDVRWIHFDGQDVDSLLQGRSMHKPYLFSLHITLAKHLLVSTALTVKQIALETGFHQSSYFIKRFREHTGITPEQFRQLRRMG
ncbi:helix-turn-helix domain-containing protein [Paenibacillus polymyxa]|uniref:helix-turn-helix domain-containing protein n=1 Tax=Paenibacillus polymyxa TaxID=1406 RepID=UPI002379BB53|nr:helix-turn-helix domain-containing protein [Paenibacillus polymyxa]WDM24227.1 helix-turn-helix domain-containing protein [Paenibacillus polymyxa]